MTETTKPTHAETDVLIAGAGPVGLVLAVDLARRGIRVRIVDTLAAPTTESRAIGVHSRSLDLLETLGTLDTLMTHAREARGMQLHADGKMIGQVPFDTIDAVHRFSASVAQTDTETVLTGRLNDLGVTVERSLTLSGYRQDADGVDAELSRPDGTTTTVRAGYLVGADGARSTVRHAMGQKLEGDFVGEDFLLGDIEGDHDYDRTQFHTFFSPGKATGLLFALPGDRVRVFAQLQPGTDPNRPVTVEWLQEALDERGIQLRIRETHWLTRIELKHGQVPQYRDGRVFLAGDAAHIHSPAGGLGMNTGMQDAANLGWKLAETVRTGGTSDLVDSYHLERHPVAADVIAFTTRLSDAGTLTNPVAQHVRNTLVHFGLQLPALADAMGGVIEQQNVHYRHSPIVSGTGSALKPGDYLHLPDTVIAKALATETAHLAIVLPPKTADLALPEWLTELAITDADADALRHSTGLRAGGLVIVRPDGYVAHIGPDVASGIADYGALIGRAGG